MRTQLHLAVLICTALASWHPAAAEIPPIQRVLPPEGLEIPADVRERLEAKLAELKQRLYDASGIKPPAEGEEFKPPSGWDGFADVEVIFKAVELALANREFYVPADFAKADWALDEADRRISAIERGEFPWKKATGLVVRAHRSWVDHSYQPYGLVIPEGHDFEKPCPLYVWLHGRGDKSTDLHFMQERATKQGQIAPPGAIVLHPFGRHCVGYKSIGEIDVFEAINHVKGEYKIDESRIVLIGFSMGGAGAWHLGAHAASNWLAVSPGAGFAETARYQRLSPDKFPPWYEQKLWGQYDAPSYVRNLFNTQVTAYSGELDKQIQAARVMEEAYKAEGRELTHLIGPGVEHKYEPQTLAELMRRLDAAVKQGRSQPNEVHLQTRTLSYPEQLWVRAEGLDEHWVDSRIDATRTEKQVSVTTSNISRFRLRIEGEAERLRYVIDGHEVPLPAPENRPRKLDNFNFLYFGKREGHWDGMTTEALRAGRPRKEPWLQGPIDDVFRNRFVVVVPSKKSKNAKFQQWMDFELAHLQSRWRALMRAELPIKLDTQVQDKHLRVAGHYVLWGDPDSNTLTARMIDKTPLRFGDGKWSFGDKTFDGDKFVPAMIFPRVDSDGGHHSYVVLNSGLTFREGHDRTNSQQNPKLPDWAIIDITQPPDAFSPGRIHDAGFFDEEWKLKGPVKGP